MEPTPFGEGLVRPVRSALEALDVVLGHRDDFDPASSQRTFRICMTDISQLVLLPNLWETLRVSAPHIHIEIVPLSADIARMLETGVADLALGFMPQLEAGFYQNLLFTQTFVCMVSAHHPRIKDELTLEQFQAEDHAVISSSGSAPLLIDQEIARLGLRRRISLKIPNFIGAALVVEHTDLIITIPERLGDVLTDSFRCDVLGLMGYQCEVIEFISLEHTAKNLMIRARLTNSRPSPAHVQQYTSLRNQWHVTPYLERALAAQLAPILAVHQS